MTVPTATMRVQYLGTGSTSVYAYPFRIIDATHLRVTQTDLSDLDTDLVLGVDFSISGVGSVAGGNVTLIAGNLTTGFGLTIERIVPFTQLIDLRNQGAFFPETHEDALDNLEMQIQQIEGAVSSADPDLSRALLLGLGDVDGAGQYRAKSNRIEDLEDPLNAQDAVTRAFMESFVTGVVAGGPSNALKSWSATGNGATTTFTLAGATASSPDAYFVALDGVLQQPTLDYSINPATPSIVFTTAPPSGTPVYIRMIAVAITFPAFEQYTTGTRPAAAAGQRGKLIEVRDAGQPMQLQWCAQGADDSYQWQVVASGAP